MSSWTLEMSIAVFVPPGPGEEAACAHSASSPLSTLCYTHSRLAGCDPPTNCRFIRAANIF